MILLDFPFEVMIFLLISAYKWLWNNHFLRYPALSNNLCQFNLKSGFEVIVSLDFLFKVMTFAYFALRMALK